MSVTIARMQTQQNKLSIRSLTLISFRDCVVLKTKLAGEFKAVVCELKTHELILFQLLFSAMKTDCHHRSSRCC